MSSPHSLEDNASARPLAPVPRGAWSLLASLTALNVLSFVDRQLIAVLAPVVLSAAMPVLRPLARTAARTGLRAYERGREALEEFNEAVDDVRAEVQQELRDAMERKATEDVRDDETEIG